MNDQSQSNIIREALNLLRIKHISSKYNTPRAPKLMRLNPIAIDRRKSMPKQNSNCNLFISNHKEQPLKIQTMSIPHSTQNVSPRVPTFQEVLKSISQKNEQKKINTLKLFEPDFKGLRQRRVTVNKVTLSLQKLINSQQPFEINNEIALTISKSRQSRLYERTNSNFQTHYKIRLDDAYRTSINMRSPHRSGESVKIMNKCEIESGFNYDRLLPLTMKAPVKPNDDLFSPW